MSGARVLLFVRHPEPGRVKTRLARHVGHETAALLYRCFVEDILTELRAVDARITVCFTPDGAEEAARDWLGEGPAYHSQGTGDLGARMARAFERTFAAGAPAAVLLGSDVPGLPAVVVRRAVAETLQGRPVIGPCPDGGYYLIGFSTDTFPPAVFDGIPWSTPLVLSHTMRIFSQEGPLPYLTPRWRDIDRIEDLAALAADLPRLHRHAPKTADVLTRMIHDGRIPHPPAAGAGFR